LKDFGYYDPTLQAYNMTAGDQTTVGGVTLALTVVACMVSGPIGARYGRRAGLALCAIFSIIGPAVQTGATTFAGMVIGRGISGAGIGFAANFVITYWSEAAPVELRGLIVVMYQGFINVAQFVGSAINEGTHSMTTRWAYRAPLLTEFVAPLILLGALFFIPDTPRECSIEIIVLLFPSLMSAGWFVSRGRIDEAYIALRRLRGPTHPEEEIDHEIREIAAFEQIQRELEGSSSSFFECFRGTDHRRTRIAIMVLVCQQFTGISFITS
jgi:SP family sugar:H+ symporter-like MFS transporter